MQKIIARNGSTLAVERSGAGTPIILVHGTNGDHTRWNAVIPELGKHFTVYAMDRRGRGESGDGGNYSIQSEYEDIVTLAQTIGSPLDILGHSFGAACVLGAAPGIPNLRRMILYEPPMLQSQHSPQRDDILAQMDQELQAGNREDVVLLLLRKVLNIPETMIERMRTHPAWAAQLSGAHTIPRELRVSAAYGDNLEDYRSITAPTLFLTGGESPANFRATIDILACVLPHSQIRVLPGQGHSAMLTAPAIFTEEIITFLKN
jgi:pimeloyl-ACP methyl ester carboxylesterase